MSDPTIQTFCCHHDNGTDVAVTIMEEFDTDAYNTVCLISSTLGIFGAVYQVLPRRQFTNSHRWLSLSAERGRNIVIWLAVSDLLAALGVFSRSVLWLNYKNIMPAADDDSSVLFCAVSSALTQYFYTSTWIWTLCYALDMRLVLAQTESKMKWYHVCAWIIPALLTVTGLTLLYFPDANCHTSSSPQKVLLKILPNYIGTYLPMVMVMITNPILYRYSISDMKNIITSTSGQFTSKERDIIEAIKIKFSVINVVFFLCWAPNLINGVLIWTLWFNLPAEFLITIWYIMAFTNPLQAFLNSLIYRRWSAGSEKVLLPWRHIEQSEFNLTSSLNLEHSNVKTREEIYPLLQTSPSRSINVYHSFS